MPAMSEPKSSNPESFPRADMRHSEVPLTDTTQQVRLKPDPTHVPSRECKEDAMICERCGKAEMYRMHAVWRCPECGFKTDCCGW